MKWGKLQLDFSRDIAMGLLSILIQRIFNQRGNEEGRPFAYEIFAEHIRGIDLPNIDELISMGSPKI
jgi:hypothetical protein